MKYEVPAGNLSQVSLRYLPQIEDVLASGSLVGGSFVEKFEAELQSYLKVDFSVSVASGMDALILGLQSLKLPENTRVAVVNNGGGYASLAVLSCGFIPVFCEINSDTYLIDVNQLSTLPNIGAVIVTHLYGQLVDMNPIISWANKNNVKVIEDCAQAFGAKTNGKFAGTFGDVGCYSFYPTKNLGGIGDGGAVVSSSPQIASSVRNLKQYGWGSRYDISEKNGRNSRLDAINAAVLTAKLKEIDIENIRRREIYATYLSADSKKEIFHNRNLDESNVVHLAVGITGSPGKLIEFFANNGIEVGQHYPIPDSKQTGLNYMSDIKLTPKAELHCKSNVSFPIYPHMTDDQVRKVSKVIIEWLESER